MNSLISSILARISALEAGGGGGFNTAGAGLTATGTTVNAIAHADGSIVVGANDIRVGVINATQHGTLAGGTTHAVATTSTAGFLSALDKTTLTSLGIYALTGGGTTSDITTALTAMRAATPALKHLHLGDGTWVIDHGNLADDSAVITINDGETITGNGYGHTILECTNVHDATNGGRATFRTAVNACGVRFEGLHFLGENSPYVAAPVQENEAISVAWTGTSKDITVQNCYFEDLIGFAVHDRQGTTNERIHVMDCTAVNIGNGLANVNANFCHLERNTVIQGEGMECSGKGLVICNNVFQDAQGVAITIGGNQTPGLYFPGNVVANNTITGCIGGLGITITDGASAAVIANNYIANCEDGGITINGTVNPPEGVIIIGNTLDSNCLDPGANLNGMFLATGSRHLVFGNVCIDSGVPGFDQKYGININGASDCILYANYCDGTSKDFSLGNGATNTKVRGNVSVNNTLEIIGTASVDPERVTGNAATDYVETSRIDTLSGLDARSYFARQANGKLLWGDNLNLHDTALERSGAAALLVTGSLTTTTSLTAGTTVTSGTLVNAGTGVTFPANSRVQTVAGGWSLACRPASAHAYDDEFEGTAFTGWTQGGSVVATAIDPYAAFATAGEWRHSWNSRRPSWLMLQPSSASGTIYPIHKAITVATDMFVWARLSVATRYTSTVTNGDHSIGIRLSASSGGAPSGNDVVGIWLLETDANEYAVQYEKAEGGVGTITEFVQTIAQERLGFEYVAMQKISSVFYFWVAPANGNWTYLGTLTYAGAGLDRVSVICTNATSTAPGCMTMGIDFIRFVESATYLP